MKCFFQLVEPDSGKRTPAVSAERRDFANRLRGMEVEFSSCFVLVLVDDADAEQWNFSLAPLMSVPHFIDLFADKVEVSNV